MQHTWRGHGRVGDVDALHRRDDLLALGRPVGLHDWQTEGRRPNNSCHRLLLDPAQLLRPRLGSRRLVVFEQRCLYALLWDRLRDQAGRYIQPLLDLLCAREEITDAREDLISC